MKNRSDILEELEKNPTLLIKLCAPILLALSFLLVFVWWILLETDIHRQVPITQTLAVPLILFGTTAIINIMLFVDANPITKFLAIFFIGAIFSTAEVTNAAANLLNPDYDEKNIGSVNNGEQNNEGSTNAETNNEKNEGSTPSSPYEDEGSVSTETNNTTESK